MGLALIRLGRDERQTRQQQIDRARVQLMRQIKVAQPLVQLADLDHEASIRRLARQRALVDRERFRRVVLLFKELRGLALKRSAVGHLGRLAEGALGARWVIGIEERFAKAQVDVRRNKLAEPEEASTERQVFGLVELATWAVRRAIDEFAQHRRAPLARNRQRALQRDEHALLIVRRVRQVGRQLIQVGLVAAAREALPSQATRPRQRALVGFQVEQPVDRDHKEVVLLRGLGELLVHVDGAIAFAVVLHQVAEQEPRLDAVRVLRDAGAVGQNGFVAQAGEREHAGLELRDLAGAAFDVLQAGQGGLRLVRAAALELAHRQLLQVLGLAGGVELDDLLDGLLKVKVVEAREVHATLFFEAGDRGLARFFVGEVRVRAFFLQEELLEHFGRGYGVLDHRVQAHEQTRLALVGLAGEQLGLQVDRDVGERAEPRRDRHHAIFDVAAPRDRVHARPQIAPFDQRLFFVADFGIEPCEVHREVFARLVLAARRDDAFEHFDCAIEASESFPSLGQVESLGRIVGRQRLHAFEGRFGLVELAAVLVQAKQQEARGQRFVAFGDRALGDFDREVVEALVGQHVKADQQRLVTKAGAARIHERAPDRFGGRLVAAFQMIAAEQFAPRQVARIGINLALQRRDHVGVAAAFVVQLDQARALVLIHRRAALFKQRNRFVRALGFAQELDPKVEPLIAQLTTGRAFGGVQVGDALDQESKRVVQAIRFHQKAQAVVAVAAQLGDFGGVPRKALGAHGVLRGQRPLGKPSEMPERGRLGFARKVARVQVKRLLGLSAQAQHDRGAALRVGVAFARQGGQGVAGLIADFFFHQGQPQAQPLREVGVRAPGFEVAGQLAKARARDLFLAAHVGEARALKAHQR